MMTFQHKRTSDEWIELQLPKQFSRLLYTNPVCFLSTLRGRNVMVVSWLTATNNEGRFLCSIHRRRHSASALSEGVEFVISVPVKGMEELVLAVGATSGRQGSKFIQSADSAAGPDDLPVDEEHNKGEPHLPVEEKHNTDEPPLSKRQKKKRARETPGIQGLIPVPLGPSTLAIRDDDPFAIDGTVAHLLCKVYSMPQQPVIDDEHYLVLAEVTRAYVKRSYWDAEKNLFRPENDFPPYLTFFGSQTFGYVVTES